MAEPVLPAPEAIDITFDFRSDARGKDPDSTSPTLRRYHRQLWSKPLPNGDHLRLVPGTGGVYLRNESDSLPRLALASDTIATSHPRKLRALYAQVPAEVNEDFHHRGYTIGGMLVFPVGGAVPGQTINQRRGMHHLIQDRFDLTLECIRLQYAGMVNPLEATLSRYLTFFELFVDFEGYVTFFHLQDLVADDGSVAFLTPFEAFGAPVLPVDLASYLDYRAATLRFVEARNRRIASSLLA